MNVLKHLQERGLDTSLYSLYVTDEIAWFPLWNLSGQMVGYQQYRPLGDKTKCNDPLLGKYYTYCKDKLGVWGLETLNFRPDVLFVTEGIFDAVKLHSLKLPAVAVLTNNPKKLATWFYSLPRKIVIVCDNDKNKAGDKLAKLSVFSIKPEKEDSDLGDLSLPEVRDLLEHQVPWLLF